MEINTRKKCSNCWHWKEGVCLLYSCACATDVGNRVKEPSRWMSIEEGLSIAMKLEDIRRKTKIGDYNETDKA